MVMLRSPASRRASRLTSARLASVNSGRRHTRPGRRNYPEASYDEASRARYRVRASRPGGSGSGGADHGLSVTRKVFLALFGVVAARLGFLQIIDGGNLASRAESQRTNKIVLHAKRGTIFDRNGNVLALSEDCETVYANPKEVNDPSGVASALVKVLGGEKQDYMDLLVMDTTFVYIQRQVDQDLADELQDLLAERELRGVYFLADTKRVYPYGNAAAQVLGVVNVDGQGTTGLELQYNDLLTGTDGEMLVETGLTGTPIAGGASKITEAKNGTDIVISIDIDLQQACEQIIKEAVGTYSADSGSVMVTDPRTGEILAACSTPLADYTDLSDSEALTLKLVSSSFEPGSVFKVLTTSIGLNNDLYNPETVFSVPAFYKVGDDYVSDDDNRDYTMDMTVREMMRRSSNAAMSMLVTEVIGAERFAEGIDRYGIGHLTGIDFPGETQGIVRSLAEYDGATAGSMAFGQALAIPMVQIVRAYGAVANEGVLTTPHFLVTKGEEDVDWPTGDQAISAEACAEEIDIMRTVVAEGTGKNARIEGYDIAGKTGTGEQAGEGGYIAGSFVASFCGVANASDPEVLAYVGLNHLPHLASQSAANVFHDVMSQAVSILGVATSS